MENITIQQLLTITQQFIGKKVEVSINHPISTNTYSCFGICLDDDCILLYDKDKSPQELKIPFSSIVKILYFEGENFFEMGFSIFLDNNSSIDFCISEEKITCVKCGKVINLDPYATIWGIKGAGNFGSHFDGEKIHVHLCDDCLYYDIFGYVDGQFDNVEEINYYEYQ
jgi:hypothetical protein